MSNIAQLQIRYNTVATLDDLKGLTNAFAGNMCLVLSNKKLYQYVDYGSETAPDEEGDFIVSTTDTSSNCRWVAIDAYSSKIMSGTFTNAIGVANDVLKWVASGDTFIMNIPFANPVSNVICKVLDESRREVYPQDVIMIRNNAGNITGVQLVVAMYPNSTFAGSYIIFKDKIV